jgi:MinD superfamily P-loop ATPase
VSLCDHFQIPIAVIINKFDLNTQMAKEIHRVCQLKGHTVVAELPHDPVFVTAVVQGKTVTECSSGAISKRIEAAWQKISALVLDDDFRQRVRTEAAR